MKSFKQKGFTLLEFIIAISVLIIGIVAILQIFPLAFNIEQMNQMRTKAALLAQGKIEEINSQTYQNVSVGSEIEDSLSPPFEKFSRETTINYVNSELQDSVSDLGLKKIEIILSWKSFLQIGESSLKVISLITEM